MAEETEPDLVLLDLALPDGDGRDVCRELRRRSDVPIVMLTARGTEMDKIVGLELGADDYVVKPFSAAEVISRIRAVLRRSAPRDGSSAEPIRIGELELDPAARIAKLGSAELELSRKEFDLLAELMRHAGHVVTREDLMAKVWDVNWFGSTKTLDVHIGWLRRKLGDDPNQPTYIETVRGVGFRFAAPEASERCRLTCLTRQSRQRRSAMSLRATLLLALAYVLLLALIALGVPLAVSLRDRVDSEVKGQARSQADVVAATASELLDPGQRAGLNRLVRVSADSVRGRVIVVNRRGLLLADSAGAPAGRSYASRPEIRAALRGHGEQITRNSDTLGAEILATAVPVLEHGRPAGAVRVTQSVAAVNHAVRTSILDLAALAAVVLLLGLIAGALIAQQIARPIRRLDRAARGVAAGDLDATVAVEGSTEQRSLARTFNEMTQRIKRLLRVQQDFVADASHQLRTPLTGLRLRLEGLADRLRPTGRPRRSSTRGCARSTGSRRSSTSC